MMDVTHNQARGRGVRLWVGGATFLLLGGMTTIGVAWVGALWLHPKLFIEKWIIAGREQDWNVSYMKCLLSDLVWAQAGPNVLGQSGARRGSAIGVSSERPRVQWAAEQTADLLPVERFDETPFAHQLGLAWVEFPKPPFGLPRESVHAVAAGWPWRALHGIEEHTGGKRGLIVVGRTRLPLRPFPFGFTFNTLFYAGGWWIAWIVWFRVRASRRCRRGCCPRCDYALAGLSADDGGMTTCPECGWSSRPVTMPARRIANAESSDAAARS